MPINAEWHNAHRMPRNPKLDQRLEWHVEHSKHCGCRKPSVALQQQIDEYLARRGK